MSKTYHDPKAGEWIQPVRRGYKMRCCDCALVHRIDFRLHHGRAQFRVYRDNRCTAASRRQFAHIRVIKRPK